MNVKTLGSRSARENWRGMLDEACSGVTDIVITRHGKPITAMIRYEDYLALQDELRRLRVLRSEVLRTLLASETLLRREWNTAEEDEAWANL